MTKRTWLWLGAAFLVADAACVGAWYWYSQPVFPDVDLTEEAPAVAAAIEAAQQQVRREPRSGRAWGELGLVYLGNELGAPAQVCFMQAERCDPTNAAWPYLQVQRLRVDDRGAAVRALRRAVALTKLLGPANVTPTLVLAETLLEMDERAEAAALCRAVLEVDPGNARAEYTLGLIALAEEQWDQAIAHLTRCGGDVYAGKRACAQLATAYQRLGDRTAAAAFTRRFRAMPADQPWPDPYLRLAEPYAAGPHKHFQEAHRLAGTPYRADYLRALSEFAAEAGDGMAHYRLGMALVMMEDCATAEPVLRKALAKSPDLAGAHYFLGIALLQQRRFQEGAVHFRRAIALKPAHGQAHLRLGSCLAGCVSRPTRWRSFAWRCSAARTWPTRSWHWARRWRRPAQRGTRSITCCKRSGWHRTMRSVAAALARLRGAGKRAIIG